VAVASDGRCFRRSISRHQTEQVLEEGRIEDSTLHTFSSPERITRAADQITGKPAIL
jgi:hypothetical protein